MTSLSSESRIDELTNLLCDIPFLSKWQGFKETLKIVLEKGKCTKSNRDEENIQVGYSRVKNDIRADLSAYNQTGYEDMNSDKYRNEYFSTQISKHSKKGKKKWIEIGPGASGTLTRFLLENPETKQPTKNTVLAIEAVPESAESARRILRPFNKRLSILDGFADEIHLPNKGNNFYGLLAEVLGHFASCEGYVFVLRSLGTLNPRLSESLKVAIPEYFGTRIVPVDLCSATYLKVGVVAEKLLLLPAFPFKDTQLSSFHPNMESYNALDIIQNKVHESKIECIWDSDRFSLNGCDIRSFHGFSFYIFYGSEHDLCQSSNADHNRSSKNWSNIFIPIGDGSLVVGKTTRISCVITSFVFQRSPSYEFVVSLSRENEIVHEETVRIDYGDIISSVYYLKDLDCYRGHREKCRSVKKRSARAYSSSDENAYNKLSLESQKENLASAAKRICPVSESKPSEPVCEGNVLVQFLLEQSGREELIEASEKKLAEFTSSHKAPSMVEDDVNSMSSETDEFINSRACYSD